MADMMALRFVDKPLESWMMANYHVQFGGGRLEKQVRLLAGRLPDLTPLEAKVPAISMFFGIVIKMFYKEHPPPHWRPKI